MGEAATMFQEQALERNIQLMTGLPEGLVEQDIGSNRPWYNHVHLQDHEISYIPGNPCDPCLRPNAKVREEIGPAIWVLLELMTGFGGPAGIDGDWSWAIWCDGRVYSVKELVALIAEETGQAEWTVRKHLSRLRQYGWVKFIPCPEVSWIRKGGLWFLRR